MKIVEVTDEHIKFDNDNKITFQHERDCCEWNYADFSVINPNVINFDADFPEELEFKFVNGAGFLFGCEDIGWIFVPCYSDQNGYYSTEIEIWYNNKCVLSGLCEEVIY